MQTKHLVIDTNFVLNKIENITAENLYTTQDVIQEIKDKQSREFLETLNYFNKINVIEPSQESLERIQRACITLGELGSVSKQDVGVLALALDILIKYSDFKYEEIESKLDARFSQVFYDSNEPSKAQIKRQEAKKLKEEQQKEEEADQYIREFKERQCKKLLKQGLSIEEINQQLNIQQDEEVSQQSEKTEDNNQDDATWNNSEWVTQETLQQQKDDDYETLAVTSEISLFTLDFAMQNIALQLKLPLIAPSNKCITKVARYALKCSACMAIYISLDRVIKFPRNKPFVAQLISDEYNSTQLFCPECACNRLMRVMAYIQEDSVTFSKGVKNFKQPGNVNNCNVTQSKYNQVRNKYLLHPELYEEKQLKQIVQQSAKKQINFTDDIQGAAGNTIGDDVAYFLKKGKKGVKFGQGVK